MSRWIGIDFGEKRIGLALSNPERNLALPLETIERTTDRRAVGRIAFLVGEYAVNHLVIGLPTHADGTPTDFGLRVNRFAEKLRLRTGLQCSWVDEAHSSVEAENRLRTLKTTKGQVDAVAAQIILQEALDRP